MSTSFLTTMGWTADFQKSLEALNADGLNREPGRVIGQSKGHYQVCIAADVIVRAVVASAFHGSSKRQDGFPTVGDWVALTAEKGQLEATITHVLPRQSFIARRRSGRRAAETQAIAANVNYMLIVSSVNEDFDVPRLGRYVALAADSACVPVVVLTKTDLVRSPADFIERVQLSLPGVEVISLTQTDPKTLAVVEKFFAPGQCTVLVGSSGVGKSTLTNWLIGTEVQKTQGLSAASRGKHTTTTRDLRVTRFGGWVIDTPGMQEIAEPSNGEDRSNDFGDIQDLELQCRFTDCQHGAAPGCAITAAVQSGLTSPERVQSYLNHKASLAKRFKPRRR